MKIADFISEKLISLGVEKPSVRLVEQIEGLVSNKVRRLIDSTVTPKLAARAFAATMAPQEGASKGFVGDVRQHSLTRVGFVPGTETVARKSAAKNPPTQ